jgi:hypothetical protein
LAGAGELCASAIPALAATIAVARIKLRTFMTCLPWFLLGKDSKATTQRRELRFRKFPAQRQA